MSLVDDFSKVFVELIANRLPEIMQFIVHPYNMVLLWARDTPYNILNVQMDVSPLQYFDCTNGCGLWEGIEIRKCNNTIKYQECILTCMLACTTQAMSVKWHLW